jgi:phosphotransferase system enzyme I (PtsP)
MQFNSWPNKKDQIAIYKELADSFNDEVTIRLFDIGADKKLPYLNYISENNPLLGLRSVRFLLQNLDILNTQLSAILSLHEKHPNIQILIPMVTTIEEIVSVKTLLYKLKEEAKLKNTPELGIMIEVPSILYQIEGISDHIDFFSIGTNDLIQYMYAADRESGIASTLYSSFHPSIIHVLSRLNDELVKTGKNVTVCGELSGNPAGALYLTALGYRSLSINPSKMPIINYMCSFLTDELLEEIKKTILKFKDIKSIKDFLKQSLIDFDSIFSEVV